MIRPTSELIAQQLRRPSHQEANERLIAIGAESRPARLCWWGKITEFSASTGLGKAQRVTGTYPSFDEPAAGEPEVDVIIGVEAMHYCPAEENRHGHFVPSGPGVTPRWTLNQHVRLAYTEPEVSELHAEQDDGGGLASCGS